MSRLDGRGREAGDGEGAGEKDSRRNPDAAQVVPCHVAATAWQTGLLVAEAGLAGQASKGLAAAHGVWFQITSRHRHRHRQSESVHLSN